MWMTPKLMMWWVMRKSSKVTTRYRSAKEVEKIGRWYLTKCEVMYFGRTCTVNYRELGSVVEQ